jgi:hypothetical protein
VLLEKEGRKEGLWHVKEAWHIYSWWKSGAHSEILFIGNLLFLFLFLFFFFEKLLETFYLVYFLTIPGFFWELGATLYALN